MSSYKELTPEILSAFVYDENSPSFLSWNVNIRCGKHSNFTKVRVGQHCTDFNKIQQRYYVEFKNKRYVVSRIIYFLHYPSDDQSKLVDHIDGNTKNNSIKNLRLVCHNGNARNRSSKFKGVTKTIRNGYSYWRVTWVELDGTVSEKYFSCTKLGEVAAKQQAIIFRLEKIRQLNENGAGYTERHYK